jgi:hemerythrin-like domain-containing protein
VHAHHTGEDSGAFRVLAREVPQLAPVLEELSWDHQQVEAILRRVTELATADPQPDPAAVRAELDGLAALLESHFTYEEKKLVAALNALDPASARTEELLGIPLPR